MAKTSDRLLEGVKRRVTVPANQVLLLNADMLALADDVTRSKIVPLIMSLRQDYFVTTTNIPMVADQAAYSIPYRSIGRTLRDLKIEDSGGNRRDVVKIQLEDEHLERGAGQVYGFYFKGDKFVAVPTPTDTVETFEVWYDCAPSELVEVSEAALVVSKTATTVTVSNAPTGITTGVSIDFVQGKSGNAILGMDATVSVAGFTYTFAANVIPDDLVAGDYIALAGKTPVVQLPDEVYSYLETETAIRVLRAIGDFENANALAEEAKEEAKNIKIMMEPRIEGEQTKILNRNSLLRGARNRYRMGMRW